MAPDGVRDVLEGVLLLAGQEDVSWQAMRNFLGRRSVKEDIVNFDAGRCADECGFFGGGAGRGWRDRGLRLSFAVCVFRIKKNIRRSPFTLNIPPKKTTASPPPPARRSSGC